MPAPCYSRSPVCSFRITGWVDDSPVEAVYKDGVLMAHPGLAVRAELAARVDEVFRESTSADRVIQSFRMLVRGFDRLSSAEMQLQSTTAAPPALSAGG